MSSLFFCAIRQLIQIGNSICLYRIVLHGGNDLRCHPFSEGGKMKPSWQGLLDQLIEAEEGDEFLLPRRRKKLIKETMMHVLKTTLKKLRDQDQAETTRIMSKSGPGNFVPGSAERGDA